MKPFIIVFFLIAILASAGCKNKTDLDANGVPQTLKIGIFGGENPGLVKSVYEPIRQYLSRELHMPVEIIYTTDYTAVIEAQYRTACDPGEGTIAAYANTTAQPARSTIRNQTLAGICALEQFNLRCG